MSVGTPSHFITGLEGGTAFLDAVLDLAASIKADPRGWSQKAPLAGKVFTGLFLNPSLRTRTSMESGIARLGGHMIRLDVGQGMWGLEFEHGKVMDRDKAEHIIEAAGVLSSYSDAIGIRAFGGMEDWALEQLDAPVHALAQHATVPVVSLESARYHPCQALADALTMREVFGDDLRGKRFVLSWAYHPRMCGMAVPHSALLNAARLGMDVTLAHPPGFELDESIVSDADELAQAAGGSLRHVYELEDAVEGAHVVYAKAWGSRQHYGNADAAAVIHAQHQNWTITADHMQQTDDARFMHCLPVRRNVVVSDAVIDSQSSVVQQQAANRMWAQMALLVHMLGAA